MNRKKLLDDFKKFALKGNMIDLAIGVIIGGAFSSLVTSVVNDLIMPVVGFVTGGIDFSNKFIQLSGQKEHTLAAAKTVGATIAYGHFITLFINFIITVLLIFVLLNISILLNYYLSSILLNYIWVKTDFLLDSPSDLQSEVFYGKWFLRKIFAYESDAARSLIMTTKRYVSISKSYSASFVCENFSYKFENRTQIASPTVSETRGIGFYLGIVYII